jgi:3',5'-cyclic AMP phosphodiesterase CpdA
VFATDVHARPPTSIGQRLARAAAAINAAAPQLIIVGGDLVEAGLGEGALPADLCWPLWHRFGAALAAPLFPVLGNHDLVPAAGGDPRASFRRELGLARTYYAFDAAGYHFVVLDAIAAAEGEDPPYRARIGQDQLTWLRADLERLGGEVPIVVATHVPLLTTHYQATRGGSAAAPPTHVVSNNTEVLALLAEHPVILVLQGHLHIEERISWRGISLITGGAVCGGWWDGDWFGTPPGFGVVSLRGNEVDWQYRALQ